MGRNTLGPYSPYIPSQTEPVHRISLQRTRPGQKEFRKALIRRDGGCIITGCNTLSMIDAAHIKPHKLCSEPGEYNNLDNGFMLRADIHKAFDRGLWTVTPAGKMRIRRGQWDIPRPLVPLKLNPGQLKFLAGHRRWFKSVSKVKDR